MFRLFDGWGMGGAIPLGGSPHGGDPHWGEVPMEGSAILQVDFYQMSRSATSLFLFVGLTSGRLS